MDAANVTDKDWRTTINGEKINIRPADRRRAPTNIGGGGGGAIRLQRCGQNVGGGGAHCYAHSSPQSKRYLDRFSRFCRAHYHVRQTDHATSVCNNRPHLRRTAMQPKYVKNNRFTRNSEQKRDDCTVFQQVLSSS